MPFTEPQTIRLKETDSTNREAFRIMEHTALAEGTVIIAAHQYSGRGQGKTIWESAPGMNLTFSLILRPVFLPPADQFLLNQTIALGLRVGLTSLVANSGITIKWPNDIYYKKGKISGTLIENRIMGNQFEVSVVGIGINVNQAEFSSDVPNPVSLKNITGRVYDLNDTLEIIIESIMNWYNKLFTGKHEEIQESYQEHLLGFGQQLKYLAGEETFSGTIRGLDEYGRLIIERESGRLQAFDIKEVRLLL